MNKLGKLLASASVLALMTALAPEAWAQSPPAGTVSIQHSPQHADAATFFMGQANGATSCNAVSQTSASDTITIPASGGNSVYLTGIYIQNSTDATGVTQVPTVSLTGIGANGSAVFLSAASALTTVQGIPPMYSWIFPNGLKGLAGSSVTIVPSAAQSAHNILCMQAAGYYAP